MAYDAPLRPLSTYDLFEIAQWVDSSDYQAAYLDSGGELRKLSASRGDAEKSYRRLLALVSPGAGVDTRL